MTSACKPLIVRRSQRVDESLQHGFNWTLEFSRHWRPFTPQALGAVVIPLKLQTGLQYRVTQAGQTAQYDGGCEPDWPVRAGKRVIDGTVTWDAEEIDADSLERTILTSVWTPVPAVGITITQQTVDNEAGKQRTACQIVVATPGEFEIINEVGTSDALIYVGIIKLSVE